MILLQAALFLVPGWPVWLELPWSGFEDFVVTTKGEVVVYSSFFGRFLVYDLAGRLKSSLPAVRNRGAFELATDLSGRLLLRNSSTIWVADDLDAENFDLRRLPEVSSAGFILLANGVVAAEETSLGVSVPERPVAAGELLFGARHQRNESFEVSGQGYIERTNDRLVFHRVDGVDLVISTPWYLYWMKSPFPAGLAWLGAFFLGWSQPWRSRGDQR